MMADMKIAGIYFSGTGNTKHCVSTFVNELHPNAVCYPLEGPKAVQAMVAHEEIVLGYPVYYSSLPKIVWDFMAENAAAFAGKKIFLIATMGLFSGDGTGCAARILKTYGAQITGGLHVKMPDCIGDEKVLKKTPAQNRQIVKAATEKIKKAAHCYKSGKPAQEGLRFWHHVAGLFGQRLWFYNKTKKYSNKIKINPNKCVGCGICERACPMANLILENGRAVSQGRCTLCYRCFSVCPKQAITILGKTVYEQCRLENYI